MKDIYIMNNIRVIEKETGICRKGYFVVADSDRFGKDEIMCQLSTLNQAIAWLEVRGFTDYEFISEIPTVKDMVRKEIASHGKIQIGNAMYRNLYEENGHFYGYSNSNGYTDITSAIENAVIMKNGSVSTWFYRWNNTVRYCTMKFGNACTW